MQTVPIKVSIVLQRIYQEIDSQLIFLIFKAGFGSYCGVLPIVLLTKNFPSLQQLKTVPKLWYAYHLWYIKFFQMASEQLIKVY